MAYVVTPFAYTYIYIPKYIERSLITLPAVQYGTRDIYHVYIRYINLKEKKYIRLCKKIFIFITDKTKLLRNKSYLS